MWYGRAWHGMDNKARFHLQDQEGSSIMVQPQPNNPFTSPAPPGGGGPAPRPRDLVGCLVAYSPTAFIAAGAPGNTTGVGGSGPRDRVTADLVLLETPNGAVAFGGSPEWEQQPTPHSHTVMAPARFTGVWVTNQTIVNNALAPGGQPLVGHMVLGRVVRSEVGQRPFNLMKVDGTPDMDKAIALWSQIQMGALPYNQPVAIAGVAQPPPPGSVSYGAPAPPAPQDAFAAWQAQQAAKLAPAPTPAVPPAPAGWSPQVWGGLSDDQRAQVLATIAPTTAQPQSQQPPW